MPSGLENLPTRWRPCCHPPKKCAYWLRRYAHMYAPVLTPVTHTTSRQLNSLRLKEPFRKTKKNETNMCAQNISPTTQFGCPHPSRKDLWVKWRYSLLMLRQHKLICHVDPLVTFFCSDLENNSGALALQKKHSTSYYRDLCHLPRVRVCVCARACVHH